MTFFSGLNGTSQRIGGRAIPRWLLGSLQEMSSNVTDPLSTFNTELF